MKYRSDHVLSMGKERLTLAFHNIFQIQCFSGPSCSKLTMSLVNDSLKFTSSDTRIR